MHFPRLASAMGRSDLLQDPRFAMLQTRMDNVDAVELIVGAFVAEKDGADILKMMKAAEVLCAKVATIDSLLKDPYVREAGHIVTIPHKVTGDIPVQGNPIRLDGRHMAMRRAGPAFGRTRLRGGG